MFANSRPKMWLIFWTACSCKPGALTILCWCCGRSFSSARLRAGSCGEVDLLAMVEKRTGPPSEIEIFTPEELRKLIAAAPGRVATCIALQAFAGIRTSEILRLTWKDVARRHGHIEIAAGKAKTASRRLIPICENLAEWLRHADRQGERVWPVTASEYYAQQARAASAAAIDWKANALRPSFITYRLAQTKDVAEVALEAGNSPTMIFRHYRELATVAEVAEMVWHSTGMRKRSVSYAKLPSGGSHPKGLLKTATAARSRARVVNTGGFFLSAPAQFDRFDFRTHFCHCYEWLPDATVLTSRQGFRPVDGRSWHKNDGIPLLT
jgi:hypothetical protein